MSCVLAVISTVKSLYRWSPNASVAVKDYVPKNLVTKVLAHEEPGHRGPGSIKNPVIYKVMFLRTWSQRSWLTKNLGTEVLAQLRTQSSTRLYS